MIGAEAADDGCGVVAAILASEVAVGLAIIVAIFRRRPGVTADDVDLLKG